MGNKDGPVWYQDTEGACSQGLPEDEQGLNCFGPVDTIERQTTTPHDTGELPHPTPLLTHTP